MIDAFRIARQEVDATLVLAGNVATDDPEGQQISNPCANAARTASGFCRSRTRPW